MSELMKRLLKSSTIKESNSLGDSKFFSDIDMVQTPVPMINVALSGRLTGGLTSGLTIFAGPSKNFKTGFTLLLAKSYLEKHDDAIVLFYDSEFGAPLDYFKSFGIDTSRIIHTPILDIEQLTFDIMQQLNTVKRGDHVFVMIDSIGNLASKKEVDDAMEGKSVADMTRAKKLKGLFRMVTPHLKIKDIPMVAVNHTYDEMALYPKQIMGGGKGPYYSADNIFFVGRQQEKSGTEVTGFNFILNVEKGRFTREKSKVAIETRFDGGISTWSGLLEAALESGHVVSPTQGWYQIAGEEKKYRKNDTNTGAFWLPVLKDETFRQWIIDNYAISNGQIIEDITDDTLQQEYDNA